jgi:hypothetical protein
MSSVTRSTDCFSVRRAAIRRVVCAPPGIAVRGIGDQLQFHLTQIPRDRFTLGELSEDIDELVHGVLAKGDPLTPTEPARQTVIEAVDKILLPINDQEEREPGEIDEVVKEVLIVELVDFIEDDHARLVVLFFEPFEEDVAGRRLPMDVQGLLEVVEDPVQRLESGMVLPAIDIDGVDAGVLLAETIDGIFHSVGLPRPVGPVTGTVSARLPLVRGSRTPVNW